MTAHDNQKDEAWENPLDVNRGEELKEFRYEVKDQRKNEELISFLSAIDGDILWLLKTYNNK